MSQPVLSIVIASFNEVDLPNTVASIVNASLGSMDEIEIVIVDDFSSRPVPTALGTVVVRNPSRIGCGPSRYVGAMAAKGKWLLFVDAHSRFALGWFEAWRRNCGMASRTLYCGRCLGLGKTDAGVMNMDVEHPNAVYNGATWNICGPYRSGPHKGNPRYTQVLECVWATEQPGDGYEIPAVMGACYFIEREWFIDLDALRHLKFWSGDEQELSLKVWLAGGEIHLMKSVRIGHVFRSGNVTSRFVMPWHIIYNKLFISWTCLPPEQAKRLEEKLQREPQFRLASRAIQTDYHLVETQRAYNRTIFTRDFYWLAQKFGLALPPH